MDASLEPGQVWELAHDAELSPGLLLYPYEDRICAGRVARYWRVLDLRSGSVYSATVKRWTELSGRRLVGERLL